MAKSNYDELELYDESALTFGWEVIASGNEGPGKRSRHCFAYDRSANAAVLFGGIIWYPFA